MSRVPAKRQPALSERQKRLLGLLHAMGGSAKRLDFQKLLFLLNLEPDQAPLYEFVPYKFGAFSFTSYADCRKLVERGLLAGEETSWRLTDVGTAAARATRQADLASFVRRIGSLRGDALVADTYRRFPYYAIRSEIAPRVLRGESAALRQIELARPSADGPALLTIGYEGRTLEGYLNTLLRAGCTLLCDVRRNPLSRKYGFSKSTLAHACEGVGILYEHLPELGIASDRRKGLETLADYEALFSEYEQEDLPEQGDALHRIKAWIQSGHRVALTCFEREPQSCHRHCVAEALERVGMPGLAARHL